VAIAKAPSKASRYVEELKSLITDRLPDAQFLVTRMPDTRKGIAIWTYTSGEYEDVENLVTEREFEIMIDEGLFIYVLPMPLDMSNGKHV